MKRLIIIYVFVLIIVFCWPFSTSAEIVTIDEARQIAANWVQLHRHYGGDWSEFQSANVRKVEEFRRDNKLLGYYCTIEPSGFVLVEAVKGLAPVKAYADNSYINIESDEGPADLLKLKLEEIQHEVELQAGPLDQISVEEVNALNASAYHTLWDRLNVSAKAFENALSTLEPDSNYSQGGVLLKSSWRQGDPYNRYCPAASNGCTWTRCSVGCVALSGSQIMRYWSWPPGRYWKAMPDFIDSTSSDYKVNSVAELCASVGSAVNMQYCDSLCLSLAYLSDMEGVFENWWYADCAFAMRKDYTQDDWWAGPGMIKDQLNANRPIQYGIFFHAIVLDGWRDNSGQYEVHMNYGWGDTATNTWYVVDNLLQVVDTATYMSENMVIGIAPLVSMGSNISGYIESIYGFPYRYVDRDCLGSSANFQEGQLIQFLPGKVLECESGYVKVNGTPTLHSKLYVHELNRGIRIENGAVKFYPGGGIKFTQIRPGP